MLRFGFLPSDFNPMVLMLGEADDLGALAAVLRDFATAPREMRLETLGFCAAAKGTRLMLAPGEGGLHRVGSDHDAFAWSLDAARALDGAALLEALAAPDRPAGSVLLEEGAVALKVSRGEYTEDFLRA
jgi:hypothetical protein